jgi:hypothetical protein
MSNIKPKRPTGVKVLGIFSILVAIVSFIVAMEVYKQVSLARLLGENYSVFEMIAMFLILSMILFFVISALVFSGKGRKIVMGFAIVNIIFGILSLIGQVPGGIIPIIMSVVTIAYLSKQHVKGFFNGSSVRAIPSNFDDDLPPKNLDGLNSTDDENPLDILKKRYALGEISKEEFNEVKNNLD